MKINTNFITMPCNFSKADTKCSLRVYGSYLRVPPSINTNISIDSLNLDGEYVAVYENYLEDTWVIFRSHIDSFGIYYTFQNDEILVSNNLFDLAGLVPLLTWNRQALSDYFEAGWNNIQKKDRTPFDDIHKLPANYYMEYSKRKISVKKWNVIAQKKIYTLKNLDDFKKEFFSTLEYYLKEYITDTTGFTVSGGTDSSTVSCYANKMFPQNDFSYYSTKYDDVDDESALTQSLGKTLKKDINFIDPSLPDSFVETLAKIQEIVQSPYSDIEGLSHISFFENLSKEKASEILTGFGADLTFGGTPYEYPPLIKHYLRCLQPGKARNVFIAYKKGVGEYSINTGTDFIKYAKDFYLTPVKRLWAFMKKIIKILIRYKKIDKPHTAPHISVLNIQLPEFESKKASSYSDMIAYACTDSGLRQLSTLQRHYNIKSLHPFEGYKFAELAAKCDSYIFVNAVNKYCLRYAVKDLIPDELLSNEKKMGNGGYSAEKIYSKYSAEIIGYLESKLPEKKSIIKIEELMKMIRNGETSDLIFRGLNIVVFEDLIERKFSKRIGIK